MTDAQPAVAVIGCGHWGRNLVRNFHALGALATVCDDDTGVAAACTERFGVPSLPLEAIMNTASIKAVVIATPAETHAALTLRAMAAGKHVFVEKPLALNVADGIRMGEAAEAAGRILMVGHLLRYHPAFVAIHQLVADGSLGRLRHISSSRLSLGRIRQEEDVFWSFAPHDISMILALAGRLPTSVLLRGVPCLHDRNADIATAHLDFSGGLAARIAVSWLDPVKQHRLVVIGDTAMAVFDDVEPWARKLLFYPHKILWRNGRPEALPAEPVPVPLDQAEPLSLECRHFLDCVQTGSRPQSDWREGLAVLRVLDAGRRSIDTGMAESPEPAAAPDFFVHPTAVIDDDCRIGSGTKIWFFSHVLKGSQIGTRCTIGQNVMIGPDVNVGSNCKVQNNVHIYPGVTLEDGVFCGPSCVFTNVNNPRAEIERKSEFRPTIVGRGATIGANATIVCGHRIGRYAFVAAGAVVTRDVPAHALVAGNPARRIGWMSEAGYRLGEDLICPRTGVRYGPDNSGGLQARPDIREAFS
jgi:UDP-2-acetamido-3-amino-2,3-dideoxy-glucuronate N-acetyltransferase